MAYGGHDGTQIGHVKGFQDQPKGSGLLFSKREFLSVVPPVPVRRRDRATVSRCSRGDLDNVVGAGDFEGVDDVVGLLI
jgi:hypothetical protein